MRDADTLLLEIQDATGCLYLSDLHLGCRLLNEQSKRLILAIPAERYPLQDWLDAAFYITDVKCAFTTVEEAKAKITAAL